MKKKRIGIVILSAILISIALVGCSKNTNLVYSKENIKNTNMEVKTFLSLFNDKNGIYVHENSTDEIYLFLNGYNVLQGQKASYFTDIKIEVKDRTLMIKFNEKYTDDYSNKAIDNRVLYKIKQPRNVEIMRVYKNGKETHFDSINVSK